MQTINYFVSQHKKKPEVATADIKDSAITSAKILDGTIVNADVNASAAIAGTKISPDFWISKYSDNWNS